MDHGRSARRQRHRGPHPRPPGLAWPRKLGTDVVESLTFVTTSVTATEARKARQLTKAKYDLDKWYAIAGSIQDGLREQKRAALVAWLLANPDAGRGQRWVNIEE